MWRGRILRPLHVYRSGTSRFKSCPRYQVEKELLRIGQSHVTPMPDAVRVSYWISRHASK